MTIKDRLATDMKEAMKAKDKVTLATIRMILAQIQRNNQDLKDEAIKKGTEFQEMTEDQIIQTLQTFKKQTDEELEAFAQRGDTEKVQELDDSRSVITKYLPQQMQVDQIEAVIVGEFMYLKNQGQLNKGNLMKAVMGVLKGKADNKLIGEVVDKVLKE